MDQRRPLGNPFARALDGTQPASAKPPEDCIDLLARELGGATSAAGPSGNSRQPNYSPLSSSAVASGQLQLAGGDLSPGKEETSPSGPAPAGNPAAGQQSGYAKQYSSMRAARAGGSNPELSQQQSWAAFDPRGGGGPSSQSSPRQVRRSIDLSVLGSLTTTPSIGGPPAAELVEVDGVPKSTLEAWFNEADTKRRGLLANRDALSFFQRTGLQPKVLSKIWNTVKAVSAEQQEGLNRNQFCMALRLVALAQSGQQLTDEVARVAVMPASWKAAGQPPLPAPQLAPLQRKSMVLQEQRSSVDSPKVPAHAKSWSDGVQTVNLADLRGRSSQDAFASLAVQRKAAPAVPHPSGQESEMAGADSLSAPKSPSRASDAPICLEARLPPLHPKTCARFLFMAAGHGSLFAGPSPTGGLRQWARPEGNIRRPEREQQSSDHSAAEKIVSPHDEDLDVAPASEVFMPEAKQVTCLHVNDVAKMLWVGHADGKISGYALGPAAGSPINTRRIHHWQAFKAGKILAICTTAWGDVWAGSSKGFIRIWHVEHSPGVGSTISLPRELRRQGAARPSSNAIHFLAIPQSGQVVWSGSEKTLSLWDALSGTYLGHVQRGTDSDLEKESARKFLESTERDPRFIPRLPINLMKGLGLDRHSGRIASRAFATHTDAVIAEQQAWAVQTEKKHGTEWVENVGNFGGKAIDKTGKAALHAGKFIGKLVRNKKRGEGEMRGLRDIGVSGVRGRLGYEDAEYSDDGADEDGGAGRGSGKDGHLRALAPDGGNGVWAAWQSGKLERYAFNGQWKATKDMGCAICCIAIVGPRLWVGLADGRVRVLADRLPMREWRAHEAGVLQLTVAGSRVYSLAADGSIKGWCSTIPSEYDQVARQSLDNSAASLLEQQKLEILTFSWNVNEQKPAGSAFFNKVSKLAASDSVKLAVFGLQEIEMGGGSVAMAAAKDALHKKAQEKGNNNGQWWAMQLLNALGGPSKWRQFGLRQLSGMLVLVFARKELEDRLGEVSTASVACGVLGVGGNKGAVAVSFTLCRRRIACVCSHFAAHQEAVWARNQNYMSIVKGLTFSKVPWYDLHVYPDEENHLHRAAHKIVDYVSDSASDTEVAIHDVMGEPELIQGQGMRAAEMLVWAGDFNYRINCTYEEVKDCIRRGKLDHLLQWDQCKHEMRHGRIFQHLREGTIGFPPTYKFNKNDPDPLGYDTSEKRRVPAWTDRIFFRGTLRRDIPEDETSCNSLLEGFESEESPVKTGKAEAITVEAVEYATSLDVCDSDHKPIWARLRVTLPVTLQEKKRRKCSHLLKDCYLHSVPEPPRLELSTATVSLHPVEERSSLVRVHNTGGSSVVVRAVPLVDSWQRAPTDAPRELPDWLDIFPICARVAVQASADVWVSLSSRAPQQGGRERTVRLRLQVDHDYAAGGERPEGGELRDKTLTVTCAGSSSL